jgi:hypothetical protein
MDRARLDLMTAPAAADWHRAAPADGDALGNDGCGCCVEAWDYQEERIRLANATGSTWKPTAAMVLARYSRLTGYDPGTGQPDLGTDTALDSADLCSKGLQINDQLLDVPHWTLLDPANLTHIKIAVAQLGAVALTLNLPIALQDLDFDKAPGSGPDWVPGSWGMHRVGSGKYDGDTLTIRTWGLDKPVHPETLKLILVAVEARVSQRWLTATGLAPSGLDMDALMADRARLTA